MELDYKGYSSLEDLETGQTIRIDQTQNKKSYKELLEKHLNNVKTGLLNKNIFYKLITMNEPIDKALIDFLKQRNKPRG